MKKGLIFILIAFTTFVFAKDRVAKINQNQPSDIGGPDDSSNVYRHSGYNQQDNSSQPNNSREQIILHEVDFEGDITDWNFGGNWIHSDQDYASPTYAKFP